MKKPLNTGIVLNPQDKTTFRQQFLHSLMRCKTLQTPLFNALFEAENEGQVKFIIDAVSNTEYNAELEWLLSILPSNDVKVVELNF